MNGGELPGDKRGCGGVAREKGRLLSGEGKGGDNPPVPLVGVLTAQNNLANKGLLSGI